MTHHLREAFRDLADHADERIPPPGGGVPHQLWSRGRRDRRRRVAASVLAAGVVAAIVGVGAPMTTKELAATPAPASYDQADLAVPDRIWAPGSWAQTADGEHPPGPLALVGRAQRRGSWMIGSEPALFGVSAVDQTYSWLDLPGQARFDRHAAEAVSLTPDGRRLGYYLGGEPGSDHPQGDVVGFAVLDLVTGEVTQRRVRTEHGLSVDQLAWSGDSTWLVTGYGQYQRTRGLSSLSRFEAWNPVTGEVVPITGLDDQEDIGPAPGGVATWKDNRLVEVDPQTGEVTSRPVRGKYRSDTTASAPVFGPDRSHLVFVDGRPLEEQGEALATYSASVPPTGAVDEPTVLDRTWGPHHVLGWVDETTVLVEASTYRYGGLGPAPMRIRAYDVVEGTAAPGIVRPAGEGVSENLRLATDLLLRPLAPGRQPSLGDPPGPVAAVLALALVALTTLGVLLVRRRRRGDTTVLGEGSAR